MDSLIGYGSDDDQDYDRPEDNRTTAVGHGATKRSDEDNYDAVNMDMSEDSQESEPELPPADADRSKAAGKDDRPYSGNRRDAKERDREGDRRRDDRDRRDDRRNRDDRFGRPERDRRDGPPPRRGLLGDRPDDKDSSSSDSKSQTDGGPAKSYDARDAVSPRFVDRDRRDRDRDNRDTRDRYSHRSDDRRSDRYRRSRSRDRNERSRSRGTTHAPDTHHSDRRRSPPSNDYRSGTSYKVNKKLDVMEKMGLQIKTPDGSMATAQQLRQAATEDRPASSATGAPSFFNPGAVATSRILDQVQKRKLLWSGKNKSEADEASKWTGTRFAADNDGKQASKFMRLMGIKEPAAVKQDVPDKAADPIKKQEELFQAMQAQYEVARATTHTMRGVGLGFQRGQF